MLHPQARALLNLIEEKGLPPTHALTPAVARHWYRERRFFTQPEPPEVALVRELQVHSPFGATALRMYRPLGSQGGQLLPVLVFFHGGGWVIGDLESHDTLCCELANGSGCAVVAVDYRMGPEHRFPAAVDDAIAATRWLHANASSLQLDATRLAVGGEAPAATWPPWWRSRRATPATCRLRSSCWSTRLPTCDAPHRRMRAMVRATC